MLRTHLLPASGKIRCLYEFMGKLQRSILIGAETKGAIFTLNRC